MTGILNRNLTRLKICIVGEHNVGKTSLVRRFVENTFDEKYIRTIGTMVSKHDTMVPEVDGHVRFFVWDVMGHKEFANLFKEVYTNNLAGVVGVFDMTKPKTLIMLDDWVTSVREAAGNVPVLVLANKKDLQEPSHTREREIENFCSQHAWKWITTSAKTGENVQNAFYQLATDIIRGRQDDRHIGGSRKKPRNPQRDKSINKTGSQTAPPLVLMTQRQMEEIRRRR